MRTFNRFDRHCFIIAVLLLLPPVVAAMDFTDDLGSTIHLGGVPRRVVSLVPSTTEILFAIGAGDAVMAVTHHDTWPAGAAEKPVVGGFFSPSPERIAAMNPDVIFASPLHRAVMARFEHASPTVIYLDTQRLEDSFETIRLVGRIFERTAAAESLERRIRADLAMITQKTSKIPLDQRLRAMRIMGRERIMTPGDDSFQNDMIRAAGGITPRIGRNSAVVPVSLEAWRAFNPQVLYGCGRDREVVERFLDRPGWREVDAVRHHQIFTFPCELTCRAGVHSGDFVSWLAARMYADSFANNGEQLHQDAVLKQEPVALDFDYLSDAAILDSRIFDFTNQSLLLRFTTPMGVISTLEGPRSGILAVGNHYAPPACWSISHSGGLTAVRNAVYRTLGLSGEGTSFLFTGANMGNLSIQKRSFRDMTVAALVTAGVKSNAMRASRDTGVYYEPGTINVILLTNMHLSTRAMTRAIITATESKTAALMDMDIRSAYRPGRYRATGTGTDNIIVVEGTGTAIDLSGGHSKMGELIASAVHAGVVEAVFRQNAIRSGRNVFQRLADRGISVAGLMGGEGCSGLLTSGDRTAAMETLLMTPAHAGFVAAAFAIGDAYRQGLISDLSAFERWALQVAGDVAGRPISELKPLITQDDLPEVTATALNALANGICYRSADAHAASPLYGTETK